MLFLGVVIDCLDELFMKKISFIFGTRPEAIKLCPLIINLKQVGEFDVNVCVTGQHIEMLQQVLNVFNVVPDVNLKLMTHNQTLAGFVSKSIEAINSYLLEDVPDMVIVQGDTTTVLAASLAAFYNKIPVAHIEAGLRTFDKYSPFPEEINRIMTTRIAELHFAPTNSSRDNLLREGISPDKVFVTGNTVIDALYMAVNKVESENFTIPGIDSKLLVNKRIVAITGHRRENFGDGFGRICDAIKYLANEYPDVMFIYPVHLNPNVQGIVYERLGNTSNILLIPPLDYLPFVKLLSISHLILTDSGGVQEEAPSLGKPVLVLRDTTERPEAVNAGVVELVGTDFDKIVNSAALLLTDSLAYQNMSKAVNPYGDGKACERIIGAIRDYFDK